MPLYRFTAVDDDGRTFLGEREAADEVSLGQLLRRQGQWLASVRPTAPGMVIPRPVRRRGNRRVPRRVLIQFFFSLHLQLKNGVPLFTALGFGLEKDAPAGFRDVHADVRERVRAGQALSEAMRAHPRSFPPQVTSVLKAGEASGRLAESCDEIRRQYEWSERMSADVRQALVYPATLLTAVGLLLFVVFAFFIPRFSGVLRELGVPLPLLTRLVIGTGDFFRAHYLGIVLTPVTLALAAFLGARMSPSFARRLDLWKLRLPFFGSLLAQICLSRLTSHLSALYRAGIPLLDAMALCQDLVGNRALRAEIGVVLQGLQQGRTLHETMSESALFPPLVAQMAALGETTGTLDHSLRSAADYYDLTVPRAVKKFFSLFEPAMVAVLLVIVGTVVLAIVLPIAAALAAS